MQMSGTRLGVIVCQKRWMLGCVILRKGKFSRAFFGMSELHTILTQVISHPHAEGEIKKRKKLWIFKFSDDIRLAAQRWRLAEYSAMYRDHRQDATTELPNMVCMWLWEICSCSCLSVLPGPAWVLLSKIYKPFSGALYTCCHHILKSENWFSLTDISIDEPLNINVKGFRIEQYKILKTKASPALPHLDERNRGISADAAVTPSIMQPSSSTAARRSQGPSHNAASRRARPFRFRRARRAGVRWRYI